MGGPHPAQSPVLPSGTRNGAYIGVDEWSRKNAVLTEWCEVEKHDPATVIRSVNLGLGIGRTEAEATRKQADLAARFGQGNQEEVVPAFRSADGRRDR